MLSNEDRKDVKNHMGKGIAKAVARATNDSAKGKTTKDLKQMMKEPASKEWFEKHGSPHGKALIKLKKPRRLSPEESAEKTKNWPKGPLKEPTDKEKTDYQRKTGRGYHE